VSEREILFLAHRVPFPPDRGDKIRSHHVLKALAALAPVHVATFADDAADLACEAELARVAATHCLVQRTKPLAWAALEALASGRPVSLPAFASARIRAYLGEILSTRPIAAIYVFSSQMAQYVPAEFAGRVVMDFVDVDSAKFEAYAQRAVQPARTLYAREARLLAGVEREVASRATISLLATPEEAELFRTRLGPATADVRALGNGIDAARFDPALVAPEPALSGEGPHIVFTGQMDYAPNVAAVVRFATRILPAIRRVIPTARFHIVGRSPTAPVLALAGRDGVRVHGRVEDMRTWLAGADLVVAPLEIARGVQNKVLEAMAMARAVLASPEAAIGIAAFPGREIAIAGDDATFAARATALLGDGEARRRMGGVARRFVLERRSWPAMLAELPAIIGFDAASRRDAA